MKRMNALVQLFVILISFSACKPRNADTVERIPMVEKLISRMTIEEKVGQTAQVTLDVLTIGESVFVSDNPVTLDSALLFEAIRDYHIGSVLNTANNRAMYPEKWNSLISTIQKTAQESDLSIPILYGVDAIHGATYTAGSTLGLQQIAIGATWNKEIAYELASLTAYETKASSIPWTFAPVLDLGSDPRWARIWETFGEDPYLCSVMGEQSVKGYQKSDISQSVNVAACLKHFLGYSAAKSGKDRTPGDLSNVNMREYHLPSFEAAIEAGAASIMINSGILNGMPVHASYDILTKLLKEELNFNGLVLTDWGDIENLHHRDKVAKSHKEAIKMSINAGIDMSMVPYDYKRYCNLLVELVDEGEVSIERLDDAVRRILNLKYNLGLFEYTNSTTIKDYPKFGSKEFKTKAYNAACEAITLLKNQDSILPLKKGSKILVTGPNANSMRTLNGGWSYSWQGEKVEEFSASYNTILQAIKNKFGASFVKYVPGLEYNMKGEYHNECNLNIDEAIKHSKYADVIVLCLGENTYTEKPGDLHDLSISKNQQDLALALAKTGKPIVMVLNEGRPRVISAIEPSVQAVIQTYLSGNHAGDALAHILSGDVNPSGKLPYTYPMFVNSLVVYNHKPSEESTTQDGMYDYGGGFYPQYEFGFGLSYTTFEYSDLKVSKQIFGLKDKVTVSIKVKNTGDVAGKEVVQLYSSNHYATITPDVKRLRKFEKIHLEVGEEKTVEFELLAKDLSFIDVTGQRVNEDGKISIMIDGLTEEINLNTKK